jgi:uncharacterized protein (TIRG00374 family)
MRKIFLFLISFLIGISLFVWTLKFVGWQKIKSAFLVFTGWQWIIILITTLLVKLFATWKWKEILKSGETDITFLDLFKYYLVSFSTTYLFPMVFLSGEFLQGYILKRKHGLPFSKGMASAIIDQILDWTTNLAIIFFGVIFFLLKIGFLTKKFAIYFFSTFLFCLIAISFFYFMVFKKKSFANLFLKFLNYETKNTESLEIEKEFFNFFKIKNFYFWKALILAFFEEIIFILRIWLLVSFLGGTVNFLSTLSILGFSYLAMMIPIPAALGIHEGFQAFSFNALGLGAGLGTAFALIIRGADLIVAFIGMIILFKLGSELLVGELFKK